MTGKADPHPQQDSHDAADDHLGAVEGDRPSDKQMGNANVPALDREGRPKDAKKICEDVIGANTDGSQG
jgi:hypothetical protein